MEQTKKNEVPMHLNEQKNKNKNFYKYSTMTLVVAIVIVLAYVSFGSNLFTSKDIAAKVNGEKITVTELNNLYDSIPLQQKASVTKKDLLQQIVQLKLIYQEAKKEGFSVSTDEAKSSLDLLIASAGMTREQFLESLNKRNVKEEDFIKNYIEQLTAEKLINKTVLQNINVLDKEASDYYSNNIKQFEKSEQVTVKHILIGDKNLSKEEKESKAKELLKKVNKENFCDNVKKYSTDVASIPQCGEYTFGKDDPYVEEFKKLAFSQKIGEIGTANTQFGTHIIWTVKKTPPKTSSLKEVSEQIKELLKAQKAKGEYEKFYKDLESKSNIKIYDEVLL